MNSSVLLLIIVGAGALVFVGLLVADYFSRESKQERARRKRRRERRKLRRLAMAQGQTRVAEGGSSSGDDRSDDDD